jgi:hypothetical protein
VPAGALIEIAAGNVGYSHSGPYHEDRAARVTIRSETLPVRILLIPRGPGSHDHQASPELLGRAFLS